MRETIIIGLILGAVTTAAAAIMTALAIKNATPSLLWDIVLWGSVAVFIGGLATLALYVSSQKYGRPLLGPAIFINLGICLLVFGFVWHFTPREPQKSEAPDKSTASISQLDVTLKFV